MGLHRFIKRVMVFGFGLIVCSVVALVSISQLQRAVEYPRIAALQDQLDRLEGLESPKLVLAGGSNLPYGLNSDLLEETFGMPVMNIGGEALLTIEFLLNTIKPRLKSGDVVVIAFETGMYLFRPWSNPTLVRLAATDPSQMRYMTWRQIVGMPRQLFSALAIQTRQLRNSLSRGRAGLSSYVDGLQPNGDYVGHRGKPSKLVPRPDSYDSDWYTTLPVERRRYLADLVEFCRESGVRLYFTFPPQAAGYVNVRSASAVSSYLRDHFVVVSDREDYVYPDSSFYDTEYHLLYDMRDVRTRQLIEDLEPYIGRGGARISP